MDVYYVETLLRRVKIVVAEDKEAAACEAWNNDDCEDEDLQVIEVRVY
jgi:hypothetical protein